MSYVYTRNDLTALNNTFDYILRQSANVFVFLNTNLKVFAVLIISWKSQFILKLFYYSISRCSYSVCNFEPMKSPVKLNSLFSTFFCYITWFVLSPD